jgi:hypothetical protein
MSHWGNRKNAEENNVPDWKDQDKFFSTLVKDMIDEFAFKVASRFLLKSKASPIDAKERFWNGILFFQAWQKQRVPATRRPKPTSMAGG